MELIKLDNRLQVAMKRKSLPAHRAGNPVGPAGPL